MCLFDLLIGRPLCCSYATGAVDIVSEVGDRAEVSDRDMIKRILLNPLAREVLKRKNIRIKDAPVFLMLLCWLRVSLRRITYGLVTLALLLISVPVGIWACYKIDGFYYTFASQRTNDGGGGKTVLQLTHEANSPEGQIAKSAGMPVRIIPGATNDLKSCFYSALHHVVSIPHCIGNVVVNPINAQASKSEVAITALCMAFHEMGHAEQHKYVRIIDFFQLFAGVISFLGCVISLIPGAPAILTLHFPHLISCLLFLLTLRPILKFFCERDASVRALANLVAYGHINTKEEASCAVYVLQLAACTYLGGACKSILGILKKLLSLFTSEISEHLCNFG
ncbi:MAG: zinc metallopeptidase [Puniceicoccales bacterium]|jgi:hypothetical protein|nr:zinc metallopeptidase [Puniceicoccales bacterium]